MHEDAQAVSLGAFKAGITVEQYRLRELLRECLGLLSNCSHVEDQMARAVVLADLHAELGLRADGKP
jgi:hypothetical protein